VSLSEVAELLGTTDAIVRALLRDEGAQPLHGSIPWTEAAAYLFDAWPRAQILDALGSHAASIIPPDFQLTRVNWLMPIFVVRAIEHQAVTAWRDDPRVGAGLLVNHSHARGVDDYVADVLYNDITPATVEAFRHDHSFLRAFHYPLLD
jgi:hypothetical protein